MGGDKVIDSRFLKFIEGGAFFDLIVHAMFGKSAKSILFSRKKNLMAPFYYFVPFRLRAPFLKAPTLRTPFQRMPFLRHTEICTVGNVLAGI